MNNQNQRQGETEQELSWIKSLDRNANNPLELSRTNQIRLGLMDYFNNLEQTDRSLFLLSITYKNYQDQVYKPELVDGFFKRFYVRHFLPYIHQTNKFQRKSYLAVQPITYAFLDEHAPKAVKDPFQPNVTLLSARLHHHAILAVHPDTLERLQALVGTDTMKSDFSHKVMTTDLKPCDVGAVSYATKKLYQYPEFLMFPDKTVS